MTRHIGVMGGMFDPVHNGHISAAIAALDALSLDELRLIPCANPNHRDPAVASASHRLAMLQLAAQADGRLVVDDREIRRQGVSYTVETLASLRKEFPDATLVLVLGEDAFAGLARWHRWKEIFALAHLCVIKRPMEEAKPEIEPTLRVEVSARTVSGAEALRSARCGKIYHLNKEGLEAASSVLRRALREGQSPQELPEAIVSYISHNQLYDVNSSG